MKGFIEWRKKNVMGSSGSSEKVGRTSVRRRRDRPNPRAKDHVRPVIHRRETRSDDLWAMRRYELAATSASMTVEANAGRSLILILP